MAAAAAALLAAGSAWAQATNAQVSRAVELREAPSDAARSLGSLAAQTPVNRTGSQGGWAQVRTVQGAAGWVPLFAVLGTPGAAASSAGSSATDFMRGVSSVIGVGGQTTQPTSLIGIRGLTKEDIANATPSPDALARAEAMRVDGNAARQFAAAAPLASRAVDPLPEPPRPAAGTSGPREAP